MCVAFFIATGSFFLGQQDILPAAMRGSPWMFVLAFAPLAVMLFWLARIRFAKAIARSKQSGRMLIGRQALALPNVQMET
jgi:membrane protein implicated in regulation of membrane protease activity